MTEPLGLSELLERARDVAQGIVAQQAEKTDREARWPEEGIRALQDAGLAGLTVPREYGGTGGGLFGLARVSEILGRECAATALCFGMHCVGAAVLAAKPTDEQVQRYLEPIVAGTHLTTLALSEPGTGAHFYISETTIRDEADAYVLDGTKTFVTNGSHADSYVISTVAAEADAPAGSFSCAILRAGLPGMEWGDPWDGLGMRGNDSRSLRLRNVQIDKMDLLGAPGDQLWYILEVVAPNFLTAMAGTYLGIAGAALDEARAHVTSRTYSHSGTRLASNAVLQHRVGSLWGQVERTRALVYHAAQAADARDPEATLALFASKAEVADAAVSVANEAMTLMGGIAYREGSRIHRLLRDARAAHVMAPTTDVLRTWIGRLLLDVPVFGD